MSDIIKPFDPWDAEPPIPAFKDHESTRRVVFSRQPFELKFDKMTIEVEEDGKRWVKFWWRGKWTCRVDEAELEAVGGVLNTLRMV